MPKPETTRDDMNPTNRLSQTTDLCLCIRCNKKPRMAMSLVCEECWDTAPWQDQRDREIASQ